MTGGISIVKMSGAGNDFVVLGPGQLERLGDRAEFWIRAVCRRGLSVGADGLLAVDSGADGGVRVRFFNPDASSTFCGNGTRCAARFAFDLGLAPESMRLETAVGEVPARVDGDRVTLQLPPPRDRGTQLLDLDSGPVEGRWIDAGVPHFVMWVDRFDDDRLQRLGPQIRRHAAFGPDGTNLDLVQRQDANTVRVRTWERGVEAETLACGSGAVAAALAARLDGGGESVDLVPASGSVLNVRLSGPPDRPGGALLTGDARWIFRGVVDEEAIGSGSVDR